jgi:serine/threonine protein phosphatase 1
MKRYVVGDIHGCAKALRSLLIEIDPSQDDEIIFMGDYVDRGPNSRNVIEQLIELQSQCQVVALRGNHEVMLMGVVMSGLNPEAWLRSGGAATVTSYGGSVSKIPESHLQFYAGLKGHHETETEMFVHAMYDPNKRLDCQDEELTYWTHLPPHPPPPHASGKRVFLGHTPQPGGEVLLLPHLVCVDTYCFGGGYLTAMNLDNQTLIQVNRHGHVRKVPLARLIGELARCGRWLAKPKRWRWN